MQKPLKPRRFPISDNVTLKAKELALAQRQLHEDDGLYDEIPTAYSDQEHELHRIRDRVRIRLNLMDIDFRNLEQKLVEEEKRKIARKKV